MNRKIMKKTMMMASVKYEKPQVEQLSFCVEKGFTASGMLDDMTEKQGDWY